jgi:hypothetical protein
LIIGIFVEIKQDLISIMNDQIYDESNDGYYQYIHICRDCKVMMCEPCAERSNKEKELMRSQCRKEAERIERWRREYEANKDLYALKDFRVRRQRLLSAGFNADKILVQELIAKQLAATNTSESISTLHTLFTYLLIYPIFLCRNPKVLNAVRERIQDISTDPNAAPLAPLMERLQKVIADCA